MLVGEYGGSIVYFESNGCNVPNLCSGAGACVLSEQQDAAVCDCLPSITGERCQSCNKGAILNYPLLRTNTTISKFTTCCYYSSYYNSGM